MVWIHGGGFMMGSSGEEFYAPDYLLEKDIVFASFNYRLGAFGKPKHQHDKTSVANHPEIL